MKVLSFKTIASASEALYKEKGSKFLAYAHPVSSEEEVKIQVGLLKKKFYDARHHCFAYRLDPDGKRFRAFDDGEPNHSAGDPILGQIKSKGITNVLVVVVRYFGGVKLGVGGLVAAYKTAAEMALNNATTIEKDVLNTATIRYDYASTPEVMRLIKEFDLQVKHQSFADSCVLTFDYALKIESEFFEKLTLLRLSIGE